MAVGPFPASNGAIVTFGLTTVRNRFQCVMPMISDDVLGTPKDRSHGLLVTLAQQLNPAWVAALCVDCQIRGIQIEPMADDTMLPDRINYPNNLWVGTVAGESSPPQTSMLTAFYSSQQIAGPNRILVAKTNWGPVPEANINAGILKADQLGLMVTIANVLMTGMLDEVTNVRWYRALTKSDEPEAELDVCDIYLNRDQAFTQKRRMLPLF